MTDLLRLQDLTVAYRQNGEWLAAVRDFSLNISAGTTYGLVGESGSGKSTIALTIMRYLSEAARVLRGAIEFKRRDLLSLSRREMRHIWADEMALVPQDPLSALNPSLRIDEQIAEGLQQRVALTGVDVEQRVLTLLEMVRIAEPQRVARSYPHQISGGMQQRVMIAMALGVEPDLLILDEPTTALDATTQATILDLIRDLIRQRDTAALYVTHNLGVVAQLCERVAVLYAGELVEDAAARDLFKRPLHPYTQGLLNSVPRLGQNRRDIQLAAIPGQIPPLGQRPPACIFSDRCPLAIDICHEQRPPPDEPSPGRMVRCHRWPEIAAGEINAVERTRPEPAKAAVTEATVVEATVVEPSAGAARPLLQLRDLSVHFDAPRSIAAVLQGKDPVKVRAVDDVDLDLSHGQTLGLVGESGSGKTTLARAVIGLQPITGGEMFLLGVELPSGLPARSLPLMRRLQIVFQNPEEALNPYLTVGQTLRRPLQRIRALSRSQADDAVARLLQDVRLSPDFAGRLPGQLSGGEKQRVALARALAADPDLLLCDEPVSSLDVSVQATILNLIGNLQDERQSGVLFISHDLAVVAHLAGRVAVMYAGHLMEVAEAHTLLQSPYHPYTEALVSAIPLMDPDAEQQHIRLDGEMPKPTEELSGCPFHTRCPRFLGEICVNETPPWRVTEQGDHIFCHIPIAELKQAQDRLFRFSQDADEE